MSQLIEDKVTIESSTLPLEDVNPLVVVAFVVHQNHPLLEAVRRLEENMNNLTMMRRAQREEIRAALSDMRLEAEELRLALDSDGYKNKGSFSRLFGLGCYYSVLYFLVIKVVHVIKESIQAIEHDDSMSLAVPVMVGCTAAVLAYGLFKTLKEPGLRRSSAFEERPWMSS